MNFDRLLTETALKERFKDWEGDAEGAGRFDVIVEGWHDVTETPTECINRLNAEVIEYAQKSRDAIEPIARDRDRLRQFVFDDGRVLRGYTAEDWAVEFSADSTIDSWWIELQLTDEDNRETVLSLSDVEAMNLSARLVELVGLGRARTPDDWQPVPLPEKDRDLLRKLLEGIAGTWGTEDEFPDWRENEYARGQLELVIETCRVITDEEYERSGGGDVDLLRDRVTNWIRKRAWL